MSRRAFYGGNSYSNSTSRSCEVDQGAWKTTLERDVAARGRSERALPAGALLNSIHLSLAFPDRASTDVASESCVGHRTILQCGATLRCL